jgi:hypothetical protein
MSPRTYAICQGTTLSPDKQAAYRKSWAKRATTCLIGKPAPQVKPKPSLPSEILARAECEAPQQGMLAGDLVAALTTALGVPPCGGCEKRKQWLNRAHAWLNDRLGLTNSSQENR